MESCLADGIHWMLARLANFDRISISMNAFFAPYLHFTEQPIHINGHCVRCFTDNSLEAWPATRQNPDFVSLEILIKLWSL